MKRTKRYGGFLIGDRVRPRDNIDNKYVGEATITQLLKDGKVEVKLSKPIYDEIRDYTYYYLSYYPNQLINITMLDEQESNLRIKTQKARQMLKEANARQEKLSKIMLELDRLKVGYCIQKNEIEYKPYYTFGNPLPSPYTRDVYTTTKDY